MDPQNVMAVSLVVISICNVAVLATVVIVALKLTKIISGVTDQGRETLTKIQSEVESISSKIKPSVANAQRSITGVTDSVATVQRTVHRGEGIIKQIAAPAAIAVFAARALKLPGIVVGALGFAGGMLAKQKMDEAGPKKKLPIQPPMKTAFVDTKNTPILGVVSKSGLTSSDTLPPVLSGVTNN